MLLLSLMLNIAVLIPVAAGLLFDRPWAVRAYGPATAARGILLSVYGAIGLMSAALIAVGTPSLAAPLLAVQIAYKVTTPFTVGTLRNPVVVSNLLIAAFHAATLTAIWPAVAFG